MRAYDFNERLRLANIIIFIGFGFQFCFKSILEWDCNQSTTLCRIFQFTIRMFHPTERGREIDSQMIQLIVIIKLDSVSSILQIAYLNINILTFSLVITLLQAKLGFRIRTKFNKRKFNITVRQYQQGQKQYACHYIQNSNMEYESVNKAKILELNQRLKNVDRRPEEQFEIKYSYLDGKILSIEQKIKKSVLTDDTKFRTVELQLIKAEEEFKQDKKEYEINHQRRQNEIQNIERSLQNEIQEMINELKQDKITINKTIQEKTKTVKLQWTQNTLNFKQNCNNRLEQISQRIEQIRDVIQNQKKVRDQTSQFLIRGFGEEILKLQELLNTEKNNRIKPNMEALELIQEINQMLIEQIVEQRQQKQRSQQMFTKLLEQTCIKIEQTFLN